MAGQLNLERKMDQAGGDSFGATVLERCLPYYYGEDLHVQLVAYEKPKIEQMFKEKEIQKLCDELWTKLDHISDWPVVGTEKQIKEAA